MPAYLQRTLGVIAIWGLVLFVPGPDAGAEQRVVGHFSRHYPGAAFPDGWEPLRFPNIDRHTRYELVADHGQTVLKAVSEQSASGLIRRMRIDPFRFPIIRWRWKIDHVLSKGDVRYKEGDDYAARIYVAFAFDPQKATWWQRLRHSSAGLFAGRELPGSALNYFWANRAAEGTIVSNPFSGETKMIAVQSGNAMQGRWVDVQRNIVDDYHRAFGRMPPDIIGIGLMTDTDNTQESTTAYYGDIVLISPKER